MQNPPTTVAPTVSALAEDLRKAGVILGEGIPFGSLYMMRAKKKLALYPAVA